MRERERRRRKRKRQQFQTVFVSCAVLLCMILATAGITWNYMGKQEKKTDTLQNEQDVTEKIPLDTGQEALTDVLVEEVFSIEQEYERIVSLSPGEIAVSGTLSQELMERLFYEEDISLVLPRIQGISYVENENVALSDLAYLRMLYYGSDGNTYVGEMIVNRKIKDTVLSIFQELYENKYPIERMVLVDNYGGEDEASMEDNNTSAFNYRTIAGSSKLSNHSYGMAIDVNPKYNPYVKTASDGSLICQPKSGVEYIDRTKEFVYKIDGNDLAYRLFTQAGFTWGGDFHSVKDYQHFEMEY